jgi:transcriptional regulator with XRE-family HTH domain
MTKLLKQQITGELVRRLRTQAGMSLRALAAQTGFSPSFMSQVENGQVSPSISSMEKIATALGVTLGDFFAAATEGEGGLIVRVADRQALSSGWSAAEIEALSVPGPRARLEALLITLRPGGRSGKHPYAHDREEFAFVAQGEVMLTLGGDDPARRATSVAERRQGSRPDPDHRLIDRHCSSTSTPTSPAGCGSGGGTGEPKVSSGRILPRERSRPRIPHRPRQNRGRPLRRMTGVRCGCPVLGMLGYGAGLATCRSA